MAMPRKKKPLLSRERAIAMGVIATAAAGLLVHEGMRRRRGQAAADLHARELDRLKDERQQAQADRSRYAWEVEELEVQAQVNRGRYERELQQLEARRQQAQQHSDHYSQLYHQQALRLAAAEQNASMWRMHQRQQARQPPALDGIPFEDDMRLEAGELANVITLSADTPEDRLVVIRADRTPAGTYTEVYDFDALLQALQVRRRSPLTRRPLPGPLPAELRRVPVAALRSARGMSEADIVRRARLARFNRRSD